MRQNQESPAKEKPHKKRADVYIILATIGFVLFGIIMVYSASYYTEQLKTGDSLGFLIKQLLGAGIGLVAMFVTSMINYRFYSKPIIVYGLLAIAIVMLVLVMVPGIGIEVNGARRWFKIPIIGQFQPSEIGKIALVLFMSYIMSNNRWWFNSFFKGWVPLLGVVGVIAGLILIEPNLSTAICISILGITIILLGGGQVLYTSLIALGGLAGGIVLMFSAEYRRNRLLAFIDPFKYKSNESYQLVQSLYALGDGGLFGVGLGKSRQKFGNLPYCETDFIFAIIGEELGLIGVLLLMGLFLFFIWRGMRIAMTAPDRFGTLLAGGIIAVIAIQVIINIAVVTGSIPPTGLPLPFISAGNTSLVIFMAMVGIVLNVSRHCRQ